jgi:aspartyl-tRNA(Asn)/glutamyl-tRNA(Gln) amidotransferase subunit C
MSELSREEIDHLAQLSRLTLSAEEKEKFTKQLPDIIGFVDQLRVVPGLKKNTLVKTKTVPLAKLRADEESGEKLSLEQLQKLAPAWRDGQLEVPAVFGEVEDAG